MSAEARDEEKSLAGERVSGFAVNALLLIDNEVETRNDYGMLSSNRSAGFLSTCLRLGLLVAVVLAVGGCTDPAERLAEFESRIPDAAVVISYDAPVVNDIPDVTGTALLSIHIAAVGIDLQSRADVTLTKVGENATLDMTLRLLTANTAREPVGDTITIEDVAVDNTASFTINIASLDIPPEANPLGNAATGTDVVLAGTIRNMDLACGTVAGTAMAGTIVVPLDNSTFAAIRATPGATGNNLPAPVSACP